MRVRTSTFRIRLSYAGLHSLLAKWRQDLKPADGKVLAEWWKTHLRERWGEEWTADPSFEAATRKTQRGNAWAALHLRESNLT